MITDKLAIIFAVLFIFLNIVASLGNFSNASNGMELAGMIVGMVGINYLTGWAIYKLYKIK